MGTFDGPPAGQTQSILPLGEEASWITPEQEGILVLSGRNDALELSVSPADLDGTERRISGFLTGSDPRLRLWLVSNWKVAVVAQSVVMFLRC